MVRKVLSYSIAAIGGITAVVTANALGATGLAAYGIFLSAVAIFGLPATLLVVWPRSGGDRPGTADRFRR